MDFDRSARAFCQLMLRLFRQPEQRLVDSLSRGELFVLGHLRAHPEGALPGEMASLLNVSTARMAATLNALEQKQLITRSPCAEDRRRTLATITPDGERLIDERQQMVLKNTACILEQLGEQDTRDLLRTLDRLADVMERAQKARNLP